MPLQDLSDHRIQIDPLSDFKTWMQEPGCGQPYSLKTQALYLRVVRAFYEYLVREGIQGPEDVTLAWVGAYAHTLGNTGLTKTSVNTYLAALGTFYDYLVDRGLTPSNPVKEAQRCGITPGRDDVSLSRAPPYLEPSECEALIHVIADRRHINRNRDLALVGLILDSALRVEEVIALSLAVARQLLATDLLEIKQANGPSRSIRPLRKYRRFLSDYLADRSGDEGDTPLFLARTGSAMSHALLHKVIARHVREAGLNKSQTGPQLLRHTAAALMLAKGRSLEDVQNTVGHVSPLSTGVYVGLIQSADCPD